MFYRKLIYTFLFGLTFCLPSCNLEEDNFNRSEVTEVSLDELMPGTITQMAHNQSGISARAVGIFMQLFDDNDFITFSYYYLDPGSFDSYWQFGFYAGSITNAVTMEKMAIDRNEPNYEAIAKIVLAHEFGTLANEFGDIPFSEGARGNKSLFPAYDTQEEVYNGVQGLLDEAISLIEQNPGTVSAAGDLLFEGNMELWKQFAYALKARFLLHTSKKHSENFLEILDIVQNKTFDNIEDQPEFDYAKTSIDGTDNPLYSFAVQRPYTILIHENFVEKLMESEDPRLRKMAFPSDWSNWLHYSMDDPSLLPFGRQTAIIPIISLAEIKFMEAEALLQTGGSVDAISKAIRAAIETSFIQLEVPPTDYPDFIKLHADINGLAADAILNRIMEEAYVAYYGYAFRQIWNNYRRHRLPELAPLGNAGSYNPSGNIPIRYLYPESERLINSDNTYEAINRQNGALLDTPVWAFE